VKYPGLAISFLRVLKLQIQEHFISFHFSVSFSISFINIYQHSFQSIGLSPSWLSLFLDILFDVIFFLSLFDCSLLMHKKRIRFMYINLVSRNFTEII